MVFLHHLKKEAVLNLCNFLSPNSVTELKDLADGEILQKTIDAKFPEFFKTDIYLQQQLDVKSIKSHHNEDIFHRFQYIQKFIDERYHLKSEEIITYEKCFKSCELELAKVALFVLSEIVILLTQQETSTLQTLFHLDCNLQEELEECFRLFITEREMIKKSEVERILSKNAKNTASFITPRRSCASKYRQQDFSSSTPAKEEIYTNSPLKSFFESPIFKKEDIMTKQREIDDIKKILEEGDQEYYTQQCKNKELEKTLEEKEKYIKNLEQQLRELKREIESAEKRECTNELCKQEKQRMKSLIELHKSHVLVMEQNYMEASKQVNDLQKSLNKVKDSGKKSQPQRYLKTILEEKNLEIKHLESIINNLNRRLDEKELEFAKFLENKRRSKIMSEDSMSALKNKFESSNSRENEENAGHFIDEDYRMLQAKFNEVELQNKELLKKLEAQTEQMQRNENWPTKKLENVMMPELIDESKTLEKEKLRTSGNLWENGNEHCDLQNESFVLNNSRKEHLPEQSVTPVPLKVNPSTESGNEAILWKTYDSQFENENMNVVNCIDPELSIQENAGRRECTVIDDILNVPENMYIFGNLNFNSFLNSLKNFSTNGSFKKVLQVFDKLQSELKLKKSSATENSNGLDLQELLNIISECISAATMSHSFFQNKSSFSLINRFETEKDIMEIEQSKFKKCEMTEKYEVQLKEKNEELESLKKINGDLILENKANIWKIKAQKRDLYLLQGQCQALQKRLDEKTRKKDLYRQFSENLKEALHKKDDDINLLKNKVVEVQNNVKAYRKIVKDLKEEKERLNEIVQKLSLELTNAVKANSFEKEAAAVSIKINCVAENQSAKVLDPVVTESHYSTFQEIGNESMLSSALCNKTLAPFQFVSHNEEDFLNHSSLADIKKDYKDDRVEELKRRNSQLPLHLQSSYPIETNFLSSENLYVKDIEKEKYKVSYEYVKNGNECSNKRQKVTDVEPEVQRSSMTATPVRRTRKAFKTPSSLKKLLQLSRARRFHSIKPKP